MSRPKGFRTVTPYLVIRNAASAIEYYQRALGATQTYRQDTEDGRVRHAQILVGDSHLMICDDHSDFSFIKPVQEFGGSPVHLFLYVDDVDVQFTRCLEAGMEQVMPLQDQSYGRSGGVRDPYGLIWWLTTAPPDSDA